MVERVLSNKKNGNYSFHAVSNVNLVIVGNNTVSNVATGSEIVSGATIKRVWWGCDAGCINVLRGANVVLKLAQNSGYLGFADHGGGLALDSAANVVVQLPSANSFLMMELGKIFSSPAASEY